MTPTERHDRLLREGKIMPHEVLRDHLDYQRAVSRMAPALCPMAITIAGNTSRELISMFPAINGTDILLRVKGQRYGANRV
jgi:hypothetical protein